MAAKIDPELRRQLATSDGPIDVALYVRMSATEGEVGIKALADELIHRVSIEAGEEPQVVHVLLNLRTLIVSASSRYLNVLLAQPEVTSALAGSAPMEVVSSAPRKQTLSKASPLRKSRPAWRNSEDKTLMD